MGVVRVNWLCLMVIGALMRWWSSGVLVSREKGYTGSGSYHNLLKMISMALFSLFPGPDLVLLASALKRLLFSNYNATRLFCTSCARAGNCSRKTLG
jgi:hypothetical protein